MIVSRHQRGTLSELSLARMLVPALSWPFPVIVQCCETQKAMCVDAKVNLAPWNYYCESWGSRYDGYFHVFLPKIDAGQPKQQCGLTCVWTLTGNGYCGTLLWFGPVCWRYWRSPVDWMVDSKWLESELTAKRTRFIVFLSLNVFTVPHTPL